MEGNIWERYAEFRTRLDELDACAVHMPPERVALRLLLAVEGFFAQSERPPATGNIARRVEDIDFDLEGLRRSAELVSDEPVAERDVAIAEEMIAKYGQFESPVGDEHFYLAPGIETGVLLSEVAAEIAARNEEGYDPEDVPPVEEEPVTTKPGPPAEDSPPRRSSAGVSDSTRSQEEEPEKPCKNCGQTKPLSEFPKNPTYKDGHTNKCKDCTNAAHRARRKNRTEKRKASVTELPRPEDRLCAAGTRCVKADPDDLVPTPAILDAANDHPSGLCRGCQKKAGIA